MITNVEQMNLARIAGKIVENEGIARREGGKLEIRLKPVGVIA